MRLIVLAFSLLISGFLSADAVAAEVRVAMVIGNGSYQSVSPLDNPDNDAAEIAAALELSGFEVDRHVDLGFGEMIAALKQFQARAASADVAVIYYAGHGVEVDRKNFMIPVDATLANQNDVEFEAVPLDLVVRAVGQAAKLSLVIVDACRNNPFAARMQRENGSRSIGRGLGAIEPAANTLVAYAAREGTVAADGTGRNSPYASALASALTEPGLEIGKLFRRVRDDVLRETRGDQEPFLYGSLSADDFYFLPPGPEGEPAGVTAGQAAPNVDALLWNAAEETGTVEGYQAYIAKFPNGTFAEFAALRIGELQNAPEDAGPARSDTDLLSEVQSELNRVGCDAGPVDGVWGGRSQAALELAAKKVKFASIEPSAQVLETLKKQDKRICPVVCQATEVLRGDTCVRKTCPSGQRLSTKGTCYVPRPTAQSGGNNCFMFNGKRVCG